MAAPYGYTIFCDDIRHEVGNKITYVGTYRHAMYVRAAFPLVLPKFCFAVNYCHPVDPPAEPIEVRIYLPGDADNAPSVQGDISMEELKPTNADQKDDIPPEDRIFLTTSFFVASPFLLKEPGKLRVRAHVGETIVRLGGLIIEPASAAPEHLQQA